MPALVEICVEGIASALAAAEGGADRVELCANLAVGGVTPGPGVMKVVRRRLAIPVHVLVRPRAGDFVYDGDEFASMEADIDAAKAAGFEGVVFGLLDPANRVDPRTAQLVDRARPLSVTFHKAFDDSDDPLEDLETLIALGVDRILTSGGAERVSEALGVLGDLRRSAGGRIGILAGGRIQVDEIAAIVASGVTEIHVGSGACSDGVVVAAKVRRIVEEARKASMS